MSEHPIDELDARRRRRGGLEAVSDPDDQTVSPAPGPVEHDQGDAETVELGATCLGRPVDPVDEPRTVYATITARRDHPRQPIVPAWLRNRDQRRDTARWAVNHAAYVLALHTTRGLTVYPARLALHAPRGTWKVLRGVSGWVSDAEGAPARAAARTDGDLHLRLQAARNRRVKLRGTVASTVVLGVAVAGVAAWVWAPWTLALAGMTVVGVLGKLGFPAGRPIVDRVTTGPRFIKLTAEMTRAAVVASNAGVKRPDEVAFPHEIHRDGPGHLAVVDLPPGIIAADVIARRDRLAGGFRLPTSQVWPSQEPSEHPGRLRIWVADRPVSAMRQPAWPLLRAGAVDYFQPFPFGFDQRLSPVPWSFDQKNSLFAGIPGSGKSLAVRVLALAGVLDPLVIPVVFELKGSGDFDVIEEFCPDRLYGSGADEGTKADAMAGLEWLLAECDRRGPLPKKWAEKGLSTTNNVTRAMAERDQRLRPILAVFDEVQELFTDPELGKKATAVATSVIKRGRALGIHLVLATQRVDAPSIPTGISSNVAIRFCMAVPSHKEVELVLGTGAYGRGCRPTDFEPGPDSGWGWRVGLGKPVPIRAAYLDNHAAKQVAARARQLRGAVPDVDPLRVPAYNVLADVRAVMPAGETAVWLETLIERLTALRPEVYRGWDVVGLGAALRAAGLDPVSIHRKVGGKGRTLTGVRLGELDAALQARELDS